MAVIAATQKRGTTLPHAILKGLADFPNFAAQFQPSNSTEQGWILKLRACYVASDSRNLLFDCTAVRSGFSQDFYIRAEQKKDAVTVRVDPYMRIERNEGVQRCVLLIAAQILAQQATRLTFDKSNLPPEILSGLRGTLSE